MSIRSSPVFVTAAAATIGALLTLGISLAALGSEDALHLVLPLAGAIVLTVVVTSLATRGLARTSLRVRFASVAAFATLIGLVNLGVLASLMLVSEKDAILIAALFLYSTAAAIGAGIAAARRASDAVERLADASRKIAAGDLSARVGTVGGGRELESLAEALDGMAARLERTLASERAFEDRRRDLVVAVSHDLRTPLAGIRAMSEALEDGVVTDDETVARYHRTIRQEADRLAGLVDDLFELSRIHAGALSLTRERVPLVDLVGEAVAGASVAAAAKGVHLQGTADEPSPLVELSTPEMARVVRNLVDNAIRHTPAGGRVEVAARLDGARAVVEVADACGGLAEHDLDRVFDLAYRGDAARTPGDGRAGLGLAIAKGLVEAHHGTIAVANAGAGCRFTVSLPLADGALT